MRRLVLILLDALLVAAALVTITSFLGGLHFFFEWMSHARTLICIFCILLTLFLMIFSTRKRVWICMFLSLINAVQIISLYVPERAQPRGSGTQFKFLQMNIWGGKNKEIKSVIALIEKENAEVVGISELTNETWSKLGPKLKPYPYQVVQPSYGGIGLFSKFPIEDGKLEHFGAMKRPRVVARLKIRDRYIKVVFAHPIIPMRKIGFRDAEFVQLAKDVNSANEPAILAGDLNCTPWSYKFYELMRNANLKDSEKGFGYQPSWSTFHWLPLFCIDHLLTTREFSILKRYSGPYVGSDHLPVITVLSLH
ncbi:MAG: hypothetical protein C0507_15290 [Cyanobacteria bacterium PR.3.49]|nr:hypothetical protein [Cyanobacteria bacterium PR.3.49]